MMKRKRQPNAHFRANWEKGSGIIIGNLNSTFHIHFLLNPTEKQQRKGRTQSLKLQILTQFELLYYLKCRELDKSTLKTILIPHHRFSLSPAQFCNCRSQSHCRARQAAHLKSPQQLPASLGAIHRTHALYQNSALMLSTYASKRPGGMGEWKSRLSSGIQQGAG